ncbi:Transmembrane protein 214-like protein [Drosera capensis]
MLFVMASALRRKPELLINLLPSLKGGLKYIEHDKLSLTIWVIAQASEEDMVVGLYIWIQVLLPMLSGKSCNPKSRDLILQLVERTISSPIARQTLVGGAVRKGERIIPPQAFDILMRLTFPSHSTRIKATERFEAAYPILKEVALAGTPGIKAMKHVSTQVLTFAIKAVGEGIPGLTQEASDVLIWCLTQEPHCYKEWDNLYPGNIQASSAILKKISDECKKQPTKYTDDLEKLMVMLNRFRKKNKEALTRKEYADKISYFNEADKHCKDIQKQLSRSSGCLKATVAISVASVVAVTAWSHSVKVVDMKEAFEKLSQLWF